jgi:hypothetical protein
LSESLQFHSQLRDVRGEEREIQRVQKLKLEYGLSQDARLAGLPLPEDGFTDRALFVKTSDRKKFVKERNERFIKSKLRYDLASKSTGDRFFNLGYSQLPYWQKRSSMDKFAAKITEMKTRNDGRSGTVPKRRPATTIESMNQLVAHGRNAAKSRLYEKAKKNEVF